LTEESLHQASAILQLNLKHDLAEMGRVADSIEAHGAMHDWPSKWVFNVNLSLDELITNIINYGPKDVSSREDITLMLGVVNGKLITTVIDDGAAFDPFNDANSPSLDAPLEEREIGGLGIYFVKSLVSETKYQRKDNKNHTTLILDPTE